jgi:hypothetical protein
MRVVYLDRALISAKRKRSATVKFREPKARTSSLPSQLPHSLFGPLSSHYKGENIGQIRSLVDQSDTVYSLLDVNGYLLESKVTI